MKPATKLKLHKFWKTYRGIITIVLVVVIVVFSINKLIEILSKRKVKPETSFKPDVTVLSSEKMPKKVQKTMENFVEEYVEYCNNRRI